MQPFFDIHDNKLFFWIFGLLARKKKKFDNVFFGEGSGKFCTTVWHFLD